VKKTTGYIILRDVPKEWVQLDLLLYEIEGGFRGFALVLAGVHYVSVKRSGTMQKGFWCVVPDGGVVIRVFDDTTGEFREDTPENVENYTGLAISGAMNKALLPVLPRHPLETETWTSLTKHLSLVPFPPALHEERLMSPPEGIGTDALGAWFEGSFKSRFEQAFLGTHKGDVDSFMAEFEYAFVRMVLCDDGTAGDRWRHLILASFNAGEYAMRTSPIVFSALVDVIVVQLPLMPSEFFDAGAIGNQGANMVEDLVDTDDFTLGVKGDLLATILQDSGVSRPGWRGT
jgi:hypothetical protein